MSLIKTSNGPHNGDLVSKAASVFYRSNLRLQHAEEEIDAYSAPSECFDLIVAGEISSITSELKALGFRDEQEAWSAIAKRTSQRYVFFRL